MRLGRVCVGATIPLIAAFAISCGDDELPAVSGGDAGSADQGPSGGDATPGDAVAADVTPGGDAGAFTIVTESLPGARAGMAYSATVMAAGGSPPYRFSLSGGAGLPNGLSLSDDGTITGVPISPGVARFTVDAEDSASPPSRASRELSLKVLPAAGLPLEIITTSLPDGTAGAAYSATLMATGGVTPYVWTIASGSPPAGITIAPDGTISGTPQGAGSATFAVQVTDASLPEQIATTNLTITINPAQGTALEITTAALPSGTVQIAYTAQLAATGGTMPYSWSLANGTTLPSGLVLDTSGAITGTPAQAGDTTFTVQVLDASTPPQVATAQLVITIAPANMGTALSITTTSLPDATLNMLWMAVVTATGGATPYTFSVSAGALPPGLSISAGGAIGGTPSQAGTFTFTVQCNDSSTPPQVASRSLALTVIGGMGQPLVVTTSALPDGTVNQPYTAQLQAAGGTTPYQWALEPGSSLPAGLVLLTSGEIQGTPTAAGRTAFTVVALDSANPQNTASAALTITVNAPPGEDLAITTSALANAVAGVQYDQQLAATGGSTPYTWTVVAGALPPGIILDSGGLLTGTATIPGTYMFTVEVSDASNPTQSAQASFTLTVSPSPNQTLVITTGALPRARIGAPYSANLAATGGTLPYEWSLAGGALPLGLVLSSTGAITGTASTAGSFTFVVQVTDAANPMNTAQRQLTITTFANPGSGIAIVNQNLPNGRVGRAYTGHVVVAGGMRPYTWSVRTGTTPPGVTLDPMTGRLSGVPTSTGSFTFTVRVTDSSMPQLSAERTFTIVVGARIRMGGPPLRITTRNLPIATLNMTYTATLSASGGRTPYVWSLDAGMLPDGLMLSPAGAITGVPTMRGNSMFTVKVTDSGAPPATATRQMSILVR